MTSSRRPASMSMSMSGGPSRSGDKNRSNSKPEGDGVSPGDAQREADRRVGSRAAPLAVDVVAPAELHDVPHDEEVAGEAECPDHLELVVDLGPRARHALSLARPVAPRRPLAYQLHQPRLLVVSVRDGEIRQARGDQAQVEGARVSEGGRRCYRPGPPGEAAGLLCSRTQAGGS